MSTKHQKGRVVRASGGTIDLSERQRQIVAQIQADEAELIQLREHEQRLLARINANRGKLDLIADLAMEYGAEQPTEVDNDGTSVTAA